MNANQRAILKDAIKKAQWTKMALANIADTQVGFFFHQEFSKLVKQMEQTHNAGQVENDPTPPEAA